MLIFIVKMVQPGTRAGCSNIKTNIETMIMSQFNNGIPKVNLYISECLNDISLSVETYSDIVRKHSTSTPSHHSQCSGTTWRPVRVSGSNTSKYKHNR